MDHLPPPQPKYVMVLQFSWASLPAVSLSSSLSLMMCVCVWITTPYLKGAGLPGFPPCSSSANLLAAYLETTFYCLSECCTALVSLLACKSVFSCLSKDC